MSRKKERPAGSEASKKLQKLQGKDNEISVDIPPGERLDSSANKSLINEQLLDLLAKFQPINFRQKVQLDEDEKIKQKHYVVVIIEEVLATSKKYQLGLAVQNDFIYVYTGCYWLALDKDEFKVFLAEAAERMGYSIIDSRHYKFRDELYKQFIAVAYFPPPQPKSDITLINLLNGTLQIDQNGFRLREHRQEDFLHYILNFEYDPKAECPKFEQYLERVQPDSSTRDILAEYVGYVFTRHLKLEKLLLLYGGGANGKSVFFDIINALLGKENISNYSLKNLGEEHNRAQIVNKLLNYGSEIRGNIDLDVLKQMASGEPVQARLKYGNSFITDRYAKLAFNCNELPAKVEHNEAYFRRFLIIPFEVTIPKEERDPELAPSIIAKELPGVLNWVLVGLNRLLRSQSFSSSEKVDAALRTYRTESDSVALFLEEEGYEPSEDGIISLKKIFCEYGTFCFENNYKKVSNKKFRKRLETQGIQCPRRSLGYVVMVKKQIS